MDFSETEYSRLARQFAGRLQSFANVLYGDLDSWVILRHDVEFSPLRARRISSIDARNGIRSSFFFQVLSGAYNPLALENQRIMREIAESHEVGLHFYVPHREGMDMQDLLAEPRFQVGILEDIIGERVEIFSFHRPPVWCLELAANTIGGLINAYGAAFFEFSLAPSRIRYLADSRHRFGYGRPDDFVDFPRVQLNLHPDEWSPEGMETGRNFESLLSESADFLKTVFRSEADHYRTDDLDLDS